MENVTYARRDIRGCPDDSDITDYIVNKLRNPQNYRPPDLILHSGDDFKFEIHKDIFNQTALMRNILVNAEAQYPGSDVDVFIPDLKMAELQKMVNFLYTGVVDANDTPKLMTDLIHIFGFSSTIVTNITISCNLCLESSPYQCGGAGMEGFSCKSCSVAAQNTPDVVNNKVTDESLLSPNVEVKENQTLDVVNSNAPCSSNQNLKPVSLPTKHWGNMNMKIIDMFSSDEEELSMNDHNDNFIPPSDNSDSHENLINQDFPLEPIEEPKDKDIFKHPESETSSACGVDKSENFNLADNRNEETIEPDHIFISKVPESVTKFLDISSTSLENDFPSDVVAEEVIISNPTPETSSVEPKPSPISRTQVYDRKETPLKMIVMINHFQKAKKLEKKSQRKLLSKDVSKARKIIQSDHNYVSKLPESGMSLSNETSDSPEIRDRKDFPLDTGTESIFEPDPTPGTSSAANVDDRKVTPLKIRVKPNDFQIVKKSPKRKSEISDDDKKENKKKRRNVKRISVKCKKCGQLVENVKSFIRHYEPHIDDDGLGDVEPIGNDVDRLWGCPHDPCQFKSKHRSVVKAHILSNHCLEQLLSKEGVSAIEELYDIVNDTT